MTKNYIDVTESEVRATFKRLDIDKDSKITFSEFKKLFNLTFALNSNLNSFTSNSTFYESKGSRGFESPRASPKRSTLRSTLRSPIRNISTATSRLYSPIRERTMNILNRSVERLNLNKSIRTPQRSLLSPSTRTRDFNQTQNFKNTTYSSYEEENFLTFLRDLLDIENNIENTKIELTYKSDYNIEDVFRNFELDGRGFITDIDIKYGLNSFDIFPTKEEISLLTKRYDLQGEGVI